MNEKTPIEVLREVEHTIGGLRVEVEGWRQHTGSTGEFILVEIDRLMDILNNLRARMK